MLVLLVSFLKVVLFCSILTWTNVVVLFPDLSSEELRTASPCSTLLRRWDGNSAAWDHDRQCAAPASGGIANNFFFKFLW